MGYRVKAAHAGEMRELRAQLAKISGAEWQRAMCVMQHIAWLSGNPSGPSRGLVLPRCCVECGFFGHTKQYCPKRRERLELQLDMEIEAERKRRCGHEVAVYRQAQYFDEVRLPYVWDHELGGAVLDFTEGAAHTGQWTWRGGQVVERHTEIASVE